MKLLLLIHSYLAHMEMTTPFIPKSKFDSSLEWYQKDYTNIFPIGNRYYQSLPFCHHSMDDIKSTPVAAGRPFTAQFNGEAPHDGGHCEFSLSYDNLGFAVIKTIIGECLRNGVREYEVTIPESAPSGRAILSWTWFNRIGERELYMNCAALDVHGSTSGMIRGPLRLIANLPGYPTIHQFKYSVKGVHLFRNRSTLETGINPDGTPYSKEIVHLNSPVLPNRDYFYDPFNPEVDPTLGFPNIGIDEDLDD